VEPTMGVIPPKGFQMVTAFVDPNKRERDIVKSLQNEHITVEAIPTEKQVTKLGELISVWRVSFSYDLENEYLVYIYLKYTY